VARRAVLTLLLFPPSSDADKEEKAAKDAAKAAKAAAQQEKELGNDCYKARTLKRLQGAAVPPDLTCLPRTEQEVRRGHHALQQGHRAGPEGA